MASKHLSLNLLVDKQRNRVVYAESGKDFIDILFSFLTMPISSIIRLTTRHSKIGSLNTLYESVEDLDLHHMQSEACKTMLLHPRSTSEEQCKNLVLDIDDKTDPSEYYLCPFWICSSKTHCLVSTVANARCRCGQVMYRKVYRIKEDDELDRTDGVFVKGSIDFIISDDLNVFPVSTSMGLELIKKVGINEATLLEQRNVNVGRREVLHLLNRMLLSKTPLTDVFLEEKGIVNELNFDLNAMNLNLKDIGVDFRGMVQPQTEKVIETDSKKISLKLLMSKSNKKVLYAEGGEELPNLLFSFLTFPLGSIVKCLGSDTSMGCLDNLYKSVEGLSNNDLIRSEECKAMLLDPKLAPYFGCKNQPLQIVEQVPYQPTLFQCSSCSISVAYIKDYGNWTCSHGANKIQLRTLNPKYPNAATEQGGTFMVGQAVFMVTDELIVKPLSSISGVSLLNRLNININDLEERFVTVGKAEALSILKASLISKTVLSDIFSSKRPQQKYIILCDSFVHMALKKRPYAESSSSQPSFDHNRFPSLAKAKQFLAQFQSRSVESEREVAEELHEKQVFSSLAVRNWFSLVTFNSKKIYVDLVREFYNNMEVQDNGNIKTFVRGKWITISSADLADFIDIPEVKNPDYPIPENAQIDYDIVGTTICGVPTAWPGGLIPHGNLTLEYRFLNRFVCHNLEPRGHTSDVAQKNGYLLYCIGTGKRVNISQVILNAMIKTLSAKKNSLLPFGVLISEFLSYKEVPMKNSDVIQKIRNPINARTLAQSTAHVPPAHLGDEIHEEQPAPAAQGQGEQHAPNDRVAQLAAQLQGLAAHVDVRFDAVDTYLSAILAEFTPFP